MYKNSKELVLPHQILIAIFTVFIFIFLNVYARINDVLLLYSFTLDVSLSGEIIIPTLLFFYIKSLFFEDRFILKKHKYLLVFPAFFLMVAIVPVFVINILHKIFHLLSKYDYSAPLSEILHTLRNFRRVFVNVSGLVGIVYLIISLLFFLKIKETMKSVYSYIAQKDFIWIRYLLISLLVFTCIDFAFNLIESYSEVLNGWKATTNLTSFILSLNILLIGYFGLKQTNIFIPYFLLEKANEKTDHTKGINNKVTFQQNIEFESLEQKLKDTFKTEKLFLNTDLTLSKLAMAIGTTDKKISVLLNQHLQISFYEFVNSYRIEAFKEALQNNQYKEYTIEAISYECGFKSKASFYRIFKSKMNMSPSEYKNTIT